MQDAGEFLTLQIAGVSYTRILAVPIAVGLSLSLLTFLLNDNIVTTATRLFRQQLSLAAFRSKTTPRETVHFIYDSSGRARRIFFFNHNSEGQIAAVVVLDIEEGGHLHIIHSQSALATHIGMDMRKGTAFELGQASFYKMNFEKLQVSWDAEVQDAFKTFSPLALSTVGQLWRDSQMSKRNDPLLAFWLHHKIASAVVVFWLALIPSPLALRLSSRKRTQREFLLIGLFAIVFYVLDSCLAGLGQNGCSCPILVAWLPTLFVSASFLLLHAQLLNIRIPLKAFKSTIFFAAKPLIWYFTFQSAVKTIFFTI